mgnify:CR=1 FL=1
MNGIFIFILQSIYIQTKNRNLCVFCFLFIFTYFSFYDSFYRMIFIFYHDINIKPDQKDQ